MLENTRQQQCLPVLKLLEQVLRLHKQDFKTFCHYTLCALALRQKVIFNHNIVIALSNKSLIKSLFLNVMKAFLSRNGQVPHVKTSDDR